jgi:hypothetical protein
VNLPTNLLRHDLGFLRPLKLGHSPPVGKFENKMPGAAHMCTKDQPL